MYPCEQCDYKTKDQNHLKRHIQTVHEGIRRFPCNHCDYQAKRKDSLVSHFRGVHEGIKRKQGQRHLRLDLPIVKLKYYK